MKSIDSSFTTCSGRLEDEYRVKPSGGSTAIREYPDKPQKATFDVRVEDGDALEPLHDTCVAHLQTFRHLATRDREHVEQQV